nr:MAG TPA: tail protein [Caudoviricetes sp.]
MADKIIGLDLSKRDGFNKAITGRVGDKDNTYLFRLFNNGVLFDLTKATQITMLGLTPSGYYVDAVGFPQSNGTIKVDIPSAFNAEIGYFQRCFIRVVTTDGEILSTQDLIYYSYGNADISAGGGKDYIGRVEELIKELNEAADNFTNGLTDKYNKALADLQDLTDRMDALEAGGALMKTEANLASTDDVTASIAQSVKDQHKDFYVFGMGDEVRPLTTSGTTIPFGAIVSKNTLAGQADSITRNSDGTLTFNRTMTVLVNAGARIVVGDTNPTDYVYLDLEMTGQSDQNLVSQGSADNAKLKLTWTVTGMQAVTIASGSKVRIKASLRATTQAFAVRMAAISIQEIEGV